MFVGDALLGNSDRHLDNFGVLETNEGSTLDSVEVFAIENPDDNLIDYYFKLNADDEVYLDVDIDALDAGQIYASVASASTLAEAQLKSLEAEQHAWEMDTLPVQDAHEAQVLALLWVSNFQDVQTPRYMCNQQTLGLSALRQIAPSGYR